MRGPGLERFSGSGPRWARIAPESQLEECGETACRSRALTLDRCWTRTFRLLDGAAESSRPTRRPDALLRRRCTRSAQALEVLLHARRRGGRRRRACRRRLRLPVIRPLTLFLPLTLVCAIA